MINYIILIKEIDFEGKKGYKIIKCGYFEFMLKIIYILVVVFF